jgi:hypothetical protein
MIMSFVTDYSSHSSSPDPDPKLPQREALEDAPFWREVESFNSLPQPLIDEYYGQYVAVYNGNIVDHDPDEGVLALRFYRTFGYVPVYIHKVGTEDGLVDADDR